MGFVRVIGLPRGEGIISSTLCKSFSTLHNLHGETAVENELCSHYEALLGEVESPGLLKISMDGFGKLSKGATYFNAQDDDDKAGGQVEVDLEKNMVKHTLGNGKV